MSLRFTEKDRTTTNEPSKILGVDASGLLPPLDGSQLTNLNISGGSNPRSLTFDASYGTVTTVNLVRNKIYGVSSSGPNFTITSALRTSYQNGDLIYVIIWASNTWCTFVNSDTAGGTKLFINGVETTGSGRTQSTWGTFKLRLTTHTDGNLYVHLTDDLNILDDFEDVDLSSGAPIGQVLKYNATSGKWRSKYNHIPKVITITDSNIHEYCTNNVDSTTVWTSLQFNMRASSHDLYPSIGTKQPVLGWTTFLDNDYDHFYIIFQAQNGNLYYPIDSFTVGQKTLPISLRNISFYLPIINQGWLGKKITFLWDTVSLINNDLGIMKIYPAGNKYTGSTFDFTTRPTDTIDGWYPNAGYPSYNIYNASFSYTIQSNGTYSSSPTISYYSHTFLATDNTMIPVTPGSTGMTDAPQNYGYKWISIII